MNTGTADIGGWLKSTAEKLGEHVQEMKDNTKLIVQDVKDNVKDVAENMKDSVVRKRIREERFEVTFEQKALGLELDLQRATVRVIKPGGQAERLSVVVGDRLVMVQDMPLPDLPDPGGKGNEEFVQAVRERLSQMGRPAKLTFVRIVEEIRPEEFVAPSDVLGAVKMGLPMMPAPSVAAGASSSSAPAELQAELAAARLAVQRYECDAALAREDVATAAAELSDSDLRARNAEQECRKLRAELTRLQSSRIWKPGDQAEAEAARDRAMSEAAEARLRLESVSEDLRRRISCHEEAEELAIREARESERRHLSLERAEQSAEEAVSSRFAASLHDAHAELQAAQTLADAAGLRAAAADERVMEMSAEVSSARSFQAEATSRANEAQAELQAVRDDARRREIAIASTERLTAELRKEVGRQRNEMVRSEQASGEALQAAERRISELTAEVERLGQQAERVADSPLGDDSCSQVAPQPALYGRAHEKAADDAAPAVTNGDIFGVSNGAATERASATATADELKSRVAYLELQNASLNKELNARPVVYQFAPTAENIEEEEEEDEDDEEAPALGTNASVEGAASTPSRHLVVALGAAVWLRRRAVRAFVAMRKTGAAKQVESRMRLFTGHLLSRPLLLWLFYGHIMVLWLLAVFSSGRSQTPLDDPSQRLEVAMAAKSRKQP